MKKSIIFAGIAVNAVILIITLPLLLRSLGGSGKEAAPAASTAETKKNVKRIEPEAPAEPAAKPKKQKEQKERKEEKKVAGGSEEQPSGAVLQIVSEPTGAKVFINGYYKGKTPTGITVSSVSKDPAEFGIKLTLEGYEPLEKKIKLAAGDKKKYKIIFKNKVSPVKSR